MFLASQIQKEHPIEHLLICFIVVLVVQFLKPKLLKQHKTNLEQYPVPPTSTANRSTLQPLFSITLFSGKYLLTLALCQASMFSSHVRKDSYVWPQFSKCYVKWKEKVPSRSPNKTQSDAWCNILLREEFLFFTLVPFFTNFIFMGFFEIGTEDFMFLTENLILLMIILRTLIVMTESEFPLT